MCKYSAFAALTFTSVFSLALCWGRDSVVRSACLDTFFSFHLTFFFSVIIPVPHTLTSKCILPGAREAGSLKNVVFPLWRPNADVQPLCQELASLSLPHQSQDSFTQPSILANTTCVCVCVCVCPPAHHITATSWRTISDVFHLYFLHVPSLPFCFSSSISPFIGNDRWALTIMDNYSNDKLNLVNGEDLTLGFSGFYSCGRANQKHAFSIK